jgi:hypothetical protein
MTSYTLPDITGKDPNYHQSNRPFYIYRRGMRIHFKNSPVFVSSLRLIMVDGSGYRLQQNVDWTVNHTDIDEDAMQMAYRQNPNFSETLVSSVTIISDKVLDKSIAATYQEFYLTLPGRMFDDGSPLEFTPQVAKALIRGVGELRQQLARPTSPLAINDRVAAPLPFDINGERPTNKITGETVTVNTMTGYKVIRLANGAFFKDSLVIKSGGQTLNLSTDYTPLVVSPLIDRTTNKSGIYQYVMIVGEFNGELAIDYHAVGGDVQIDDVNAVQEQILAIRTFLEETLFITPDSVVDTPAFRALHARINLMEDNVRSILNGAPTYGDTTSGVSVRRGIKTTNSNLHWWTIANLFKVEGSNDIVTADQFKGRVFIPGAKIALSFTVDFNSEQHRNPVSFITDSAVFDPNYVIFADAPATATVLPLIRVVWNDGTEGFAGASIQVGLPLLSTNDILVVEDFSSTESCWLLDRTGQITNGTTPTPLDPQDNTFHLPDGATFWSEGGSSSRSRTLVPVFEEGYLVYTGSVVNLGQVTTTADTKNKFNVSLPSYFPLEAVRSIVITMASSDSSTVYDVEVRTPHSLANAVSGKATFTDSADRLLSLRTKLSRNVDNSIALAVNLTNPFAPSAGDNSADVIRYVRVKV